MAGPSPYVPPLGTLADTLKAMGLLLAGPLGPIGNFGTALNVWLDGALGALCSALDRFVEFGGLGCELFGSDSGSVFLS